MLEYAKSFHLRLRDYYEELSEDARDERLALLLEYMSRHEKNMSAALADYQPQAAKGILNTWLQFVPEEPIQQALAENEVRSDMSVGQVVQRALKVDQGLIDLYGELADTTAVPRVQELFTSLLEQERRKQEQFGWSLQDFEEQ